MTTENTANPDSSAIKDPATWTTGNEPATAAQMDFLRTLADRTGETLKSEMTKSEAAEMIDSLQQQQPVSGSADAVKDPATWTTGGEPATASQQSYLHTLATEAGEQVDANLTKSEASEKIDELQQKTGRGTENQQ